MSVLRIGAFESFATYLATQVPSLAGLITVLPVDAAQKLVIPGLTIVPISFKYQTSQEDQWTQDDAADTQTITVGHFEGIVQLRLMATSVFKRAELEELILNAFLAEEGRPGIMVTEVADFEDAVCSWELEDQDWRDELAFAKKWQSILTVTARIPAMVTRTGVYTIDHLYLALTQDLETAYASLAPSAVETVEIDEDGDIT